MIYRLLKLPIRLTLYIFFSRIIITGKQYTHTKGPALLVSNHPNSFLDAILIAAFFHEPVHFLARGDAFKKPWHAILLKSLQMIPIYRMTEGREHMHLNQDAFDRSVELLKEGKLVLIFIEGISKHTHQLQPFKKGAARIARQTIAAGIYPLIIPIQLRYEHYRGLGKYVQLQVYTPVEAKEISTGDTEQESMQQFNNTIIDIMRQPLPTPRPGRKQTAFILPAIVGFLIYAPLYTPIIAFVRKKTKNTVFHDSVLFGMLFLFFPIYTLLIVVLLNSTWYNTVIEFICFSLFAYAASRVITCQSYKNG